MGLITYEDEVICSIPPAKLFKAIVLHGDNLVPKILPEEFKSIKIIEGDGGVGSIKLVTFGEGSQYKSLKHRVDEIDEANHVYKYSIIEGDVLGENIESISYVLKIEASADGGSVCKTVNHYHTKHDAHGITEEKIKEGKEKAKDFFKAVEAHLHAHPDAC
ncbi:major allergen Pru ar 1-like [Primulina huaijiensis]|uniref:major allergen Pru ar 1-like n=1 Tax=Primulina huaijiensis TaxID=1492673 RepID=UPI003CC79432